MSTTKTIKTTIEAQQDIAKVMGDLSTKATQIRSIIETRPDEHSPEELEMINEYLVEAEKHQDELKEIHDEFQEVNEKFLEDYDNVVKETTLSGIISNMEGLIAKYKEEEKVEMAAHYTGILAELRNSYTLEPLINQIPKIKNLAKIAQIDNKTFAKTIKKINTKFAKERNYSFMPIQTTHEALLINGYSQQEAGVFINFLAGHILPIDFNKFEGRAFFISQLQQNIVKLAVLDKKDELNSAIRTIIDTVNNANNEASKEFFKH